MTGYRLPGLATKTTYTTLKIALRMCAGNSKCKGVTREANKKYSLNTSSDPKAKTGKKCYLKGGLKPTKHTVTFGGKRHTVTRDIYTDTYIIIQIYCVLIF